ncbi:uncharacterized protein LOC125776757 [Bactrocera dorsalis]|uniref:Uncharacterized protein LOC125776757 n=1 Tax=Bactrocera dorsalis TaxID=27457 RepID=A0ABM3JAK6_BACDO|nr:uncharacterized protein LOC125776757 [Bactrocera dorsalis]
MSTRKYQSESEKRKRKKESEEQNKKLPKRDGKAENDDISGNIAGPDNSEYLDSEQPQPGTSKSLNESCLDIEKLKSLPHVTAKDNFKELNDQVKRFVIENGHCKPKGPFLRDSYNRSFLDKYYYTVSKSGVKLERTWLSYSLLL